MPHSTSIKRAAVLVLSSSLVALILLKKHFSDMDHTQKNQSPGSREDGNSEPGMNGTSVSDSGQHPTNTEALNGSGRAINSDKAARKKTFALYCNITDRIPYEVDWGIRTEALRYVSQPEHVIIALSSFFAGCENHGTLYIDAWPGYQLRDYMLDAGIVKCAEVFLKMYPFTLALDELEEIRDRLSEDNYLDRLEVIESAMKKIEREMPSETWEEVEVLLWAYAQKHGLDKLIANDSSGR